MSLVSWFCRDSYVLEKVKQEGREHLYVNELEKALARDRLKLLFERNQR